MFPDFATLYVAPFTDDALYNEQTAKARDRAEIAPGSRRDRAEIAPRCHAAFTHTRDEIALKSHKLPGAVEGTGRGLQVAFWAQSSFYGLNLNGLREEAQTF